MNMQPRIVGTSTRRARQLLGCRCQLVSCQRCRRMSTLISLNKSRYALPQLPFSLSETITTCFQPWENAKITYHITVCVSTDEMQEFGSLPPIIGGFRGFSRHRRKLPADESGCLPSAQPLYTEGPWGSNGNLELVPTYGLFVSLTS